MIYLYPFSRGESKRLLELKIILIKIQKKKSVNAYIEKPMKR